MKIALCTTTIHSARSMLELCAACIGKVDVYVAGDRNTPKAAYEAALAAGASVCLPESSHQWKCSEPIGWETTARRNIAFLHALKAGADIVVSMDTDNYPVSTDYFWRFETRMLRPFSGLMASSRTEWFDAGQLLSPWQRHRGIPHGFHKHDYSPVTGARIGVMAGLVLGNSDVDATTRIEQPEYAGTTEVSEIARAGVVVSPCTHTVFNTQSTAMLRELVPAWFLMPGVGRYDDIWASLVVRRVMRERDLHVHFGLPLVYQQRHEHDLIEDLANELDGMRHTRALADLLDHTPLAGRSVIEDTRTIYGVLGHVDYIPKRAVEAANAYLDDCEGILG